MLATTRETFEGALCWWSINQWYPNPWHVFPPSARPENAWSGSVLYPPVPYSFPPLALVSSLRWEAMLDGAQDYEYQLLLEQRVAAAAARNDTGLAPLLASARRVLAARARLVTGWSFSHSVPYARNMSRVDEVRRETARAIESLPA